MSGSRGKEKLFASEAELVAEFCRLVAAKANARAPKWTAYHETCGWDVLMVSDQGVQIGFEAKLALNPKVLSQAIPGDSWYRTDGPDHRAVLVPADGLQQHMSELAHHLGITVVQVRRIEGWNGRDYFDFGPRLPDHKSSYDQSEWPLWLPAERHKLPEYVPDVLGGHAAPVQLSEWKIKAIRLLILLERLGGVTRKHMNALQISSTRWTAPFHGFLVPGPEARSYVSCGRTPDLKAQHPTVWAQIDADWEKWAPSILEKAG